VTRDSRRELEELRLFGPVKGGDPGGCGLLGEGQVASSGIRAKDFSVFCSREEEKT
jgi:hypothetical protein